MAKSSREYWKERESKNRKKNIKNEAEYVKEINDIYDYMMDKIQKEINGFYAKYAKKEGITIAEAKKRVSKLDIEEYARKAKKYVKKKDFSDEANAEMRLYNATMKINRLEMLKANIGLELLDGFDDLQKYFDTILTDRTLKEFERQAGILGKTIQNNQNAAREIVNASFHNAAFSDRIWMYQGMLKAELSKLLQEGLIQGRSSRELARHLTKLFGVSKYRAETLMTTELRRVQTGAAKRSYEENGNEEYEFLTANAMGPCEECQKLDGKVFKVKDMMPGENAPPMHPRCHCCTAPHWDEEEYKAWLDFIDKGGTTEEWERVRAKSKASDSELQNYKKVIGGTEKTFNDHPFKELHTRRVATYRSDIYISDNADIKPRALHRINKNTEDAMKAWKISIKRKPTIVIVSSLDMPTAWGRYDAITNTVYYIPEITDKELQSNGITEWHETWHMKQAENYRKKFGDITRNNYIDYIKYSCKRAKKVIDGFGVTEYNVGEISDYAKKMYLYGRYDEVEAEYMVKHRKGQ